jgi:hypothetical protein
MEEMRQHFFWFRAKARKFLRNDSVVKIRGTKENNTKEVTGSEQK